MDVKRLHEMPAERRTGPIFVNEVHKKEGFTEQAGDNAISVNEIFFAPGERTADHVHTIRQILYVTGGHGIVATEDEEYEVSVGDVISIPPDEVHWHGAQPQSTFSHISIVVRDEQEGGTLPAE